MLVGDFSLAGTQKRGGIESRGKEVVWMDGWTYVALAADGLLAVVLGGKSLKGGLDDTTTQTEDQVKGGLL